jgi:acyl-CoA thioesterase I
MIMRSKVVSLLLVTLMAGCARDEAAPPPDPQGGGAAAVRADEPSSVPADLPAGAGGDRENILFVGTSLTAGYGLGEEFAYPALIQQRIDAEGLQFRAVNAGISGETSAGGLRRIDWMLQQPVGVLVLELGANDGLRGLDPGALRGNLETILERTRAAYPAADIVILGMEAPPNLGAGYTERFRAVFSDLAREYDAAFVPFLLDGVAAVPQLNLDDGIHPNEQGHRIIANTVWAELGPILERRAVAREAAR